MPAFIGFSAPGGVDGGPHLRQRPGTRPELLGSLHLSHVPFHLEASEPLHVAWEVVIRAHALLFVGGGIGRPVLYDLIARLLLGVEARVDILLGRGAAHQADHRTGSSLAGFLNIDTRHLPAPLRLERGNALARLGHVRTGAELLNIAGECRGGADLLSVGPSLVVRVLAGLLIERGKPLARLGHVRASAEVLSIRGESRGGAGALCVGPGLLVRRFAGLFVERDDALARLRYVRTGAEVLQIRRIGCDGAGLLGVGPGLLVGLLARLLIGRLLLLLCRRLLRIRGLAASGHQGGPRNDRNDRQFQKCDTSSAPGLLTQITSHGRPFPGLRAPAAPRSTPTRVSSSICPETPAWSKINRARPPRLPAPPTRRRWRRFQGALPDRSVIELNAHAVRGIDRAEIGPGNPQATRVIHPASGWLADLVEQVELPTVLGDEGEARLSRYATRGAPIWARQIHALGRRVGCDHRC